MKPRSLDPALNKLLRQYEPLSKEQERDLFGERVEERRQGQERGDAWQVLVTHNLRLVVYRAIRLRGRGAELDDLISEGVCGLFVAVDRFDLSRGTRFSTYATWWIDHYLHRAIEAQGQMVRIPGPVQNKLHELVKLHNRCLNRHGRLPKPHEVYRHLNCSGDTAKVLNQLLKQRCVSLDSHSLFERSSPQFEPPDVRYLSPIEAAERGETAERVRDLLRWLHPREQAVIKLRYGLEGPPLKLREIADKLGTSKQRVDQLLYRAIDKLRRAAVGMEELIGG